MELKEYQKAALKTAKPTALTEEYLIPMIIGEVGELFGKVAKAARDTWGPTRALNELAQEYGDIVWGTAVLLHLHGLDDFFPQTNEYAFNTSSTALNALLEASQNVYADGLAGESYSGGARHLWATLRDHCEVVTGHTFDEVLQMNLAKLADRKNRGVLTGSGDNR